MEAMGIPRGGDGSRGAVRGMRREGGRASPSRRCPTMCAPASTTSERQQTFDDMVVIAAKRSGRTWAESDLTCPLTARRPPGVIDALPLFVPAIPFGLVIGLAITESGMNPFVGWSGSWLIFGGAAQLTLVTLLGSGVAVAAAVGTALVVNARHLMYSAALAPTFQSQPRWFRWLGPTS